MIRSAPLLWLALIALSVFYVSLKFMTGFPLETNFLALLSANSGQETEWVRQAKINMAENVSRRVVISMAHEDFTKASSSLEKLVVALQGESLTERDVHNSEDDIKALARTLFPYRTGLLSPVDRARLLDGDGKLIAKAAMAQILSPFAMADGNMVRQDPFLIFPRFLSSLPGTSSQMAYKEGVLTTKKDGLHYVVSSVLLKGEPFSQGFQARFVPWFEKLERDLITQNPELTVLKTGAVFYAEKSIRNGQQEASTIGSLSLAGIMLVLLFVFKSARPIFLSLLAVGAGLACGMSVTLLIFDRVHLMALVFGAGLLGIAIDYAIHYCCERFSPVALTPEERLKLVLPGLSLGLASSVIGFLALALSPFPGLQQIAIFSAFGLIGSYLTVVLIFPMLDTASQLSFDNKAIRATSLFRKLWRYVPQKIINGSLVFIIVVGGSFATLVVTPDDDIRKLQSLPIELKDQENKIRSLSGLDNAAQFFLIFGKTTEAVLQIEEKLTAKLDELVSSKKLGGYNAISRIVPSQQRQLENQALFREGSIIPYLSQFLASIGGDEKVVYKGQPKRHLTPQLLSESGVAPLLNLLTVQRNTKSVVHMVTLSGIHEIAVLEKISDEEGGIRLIDHARDMSSVLADYRVRSLSLLALAIAIIWGGLMFRYGPLQAARVLAPPLAAVVITPLIITLTGGSFTFFNAMALILVFVIGLDYALFYAEAPENHKDISLFANALSAFSTIMAFGLMGFSQIYAVHAFGVTILVGIILAFMFSPLVSKKI